MCGVFAEFERFITRERIKTGLDRAKANGKRLGRPTVALDVDEAIRGALCPGGQGDAEDRSSNLGWGERSAEDRLRLW